MTLYNDYPEDEEYIAILSMSIEYLAFEEALAMSTDVVVAQLVARRPFGRSMEELEFVVSEWIFGDASERIFVYLTNHDISISGIQEISFAEYEIIFERGVDYLLSLQRLHSLDVISNFHEDGHFLINGSPIINLNNPIESTMYNESIIAHATELDFRRRTLSRDQIVSFAYEATRNNPLEPYMGDFIRSRDIEDIISGSPEILMIEINELIDSIDNCAISSNIYVVTVIQTLKGEFEVGENFELEFFMDTVRIGEQYLIAIRPGMIHPATGMWFNFLTSRNSVFSMEQLDEIISILER